MEKFDFMRETKAMLNQGFQTTDSLFDMLVQAHKEGEERSRQWAQWGFETAQTMARPMHQAAQNLQAAIQERMGDSFSAVLGSHPMPRMASAMDDGMKRLNTATLDGIHRVYEGSAHMTQMARDFQRKVHEALKLDA